MVTVYKNNKMQRQLALAGVLLWKTVEEIFLPGENKIM